MPISKEQAELEVYERMACDEDEQHATVAQRQRLVERGRDQTGE